MLEAKFIAEKRRFAEEKEEIGDINVVNNKVVLEPILPYIISQYKILLEL